MRVLHCPTDVGGNPSGLARAERTLDLESWAVVFKQNPYGYPVDEVLWTDRMSHFQRELARWKLVRRALRQYDVVHFNFGCTLLPQRIPLGDPPLSRQRRLLRWLYAAYAGLLEQRDLAWLKRAGVGIVVTYQGDDARQGDFCRRHFDISTATRVGPDYYSPGGDRNKRRRIAHVGRYADRIYALNPDLLRVLPAQAEFLPYASVDLNDWRPKGYSPSSADRPIVLHAPTHRGTKGTSVVIDAVRRLREADGVDFEFILVENLPHSEARRLYEQADLLIDQLYYGWYGGLAVELMALGKPVICYIREDDLRFVPDRMRAELPIINAAPHTLYQVLKEWLTARRSELPDAGRRSRSFVEAWHDPLKIAARLKEAYREIVEGRLKPGRDT